MSPNRKLAWPIAWEGVELIAQSEGCRLKAYLCPAGVWTCGWGETDGVGPATVWDQAYADRRLLDSIGVIAGAVRDACTVTPTDLQLAAMVSLAYNIGLAGFRGSTVLRAHNRGDAAAAARAFALWNKARVDGRLQALPGLTARRLRESALYLRGDAQAGGAMPQAVQAESQLRQSPIAQSGLATAGIGVAAIASQAIDGADQASRFFGHVKTLAVDTLGLPAGLLLPAVLVVAGAVALYYRWKQRSQGWA